MKAIRGTRSAQLRKVAGAFDTNLQRIAGFSIMPAEIAFMAMRDQQLADYAAFETFGKIKSGLFEQYEKVQTNLEKYNQVFEREAKKIPEKPEKYSQEGTKYGLKYIEEQIKHQSGMRESIEAILSSVVIESWTAFESLAGDLWAVGVDNSDEAMAKLIGASKRLKQPDDNIRPETVFRTGLNPRTHYGSFLRALGMVLFQSIWDIKTYYEIAFGDEAKRLFDEVEGGYIEVLSAFRNALTHSGGRADKKFKDRLTGRFPEFDDIKQDDKILLEGELANRLNVVAARLGAKLISLIDDILSPIPKTP